MEGSNCVIQHYDYDAQTVPNSKRPGSTAIYRNYAAPPDLVPRDGTGVQTLYENFQYGLKGNPDGPCLGHRPFDPIIGNYLPYAFQSYAQVAERVTNLGSGLLALHREFVGEIDPIGQDAWHLGICSMNRTEWVLADLAASAYSLVTVALYDTLGPEAIDFIVNHAGVTVAVVSIERVPSFLRIAHLLPKLKVIVCMDKLEDDRLKQKPYMNLTKAQALREWAREKKIHLVDVGQVEEVGRAHRVPHRPPRPEDLATICYTSGTTGNPKGAMLTHRNLVIATMGPASQHDKLTKDDVLVSFLPLAHIYERMVQVAVLRAGAAIGFYRGDPLLLVEDMQELKPTLFPAVPRLFNRVYDKVRMSTIDRAGLVGKLSRKAVATKLERLKSGGGFHHALWDRIIFNKVRAVFGGRVRLMVSGSAPISGEVLDFMRIAFCCDVLEGYGMTETAAAATGTFPGEIGTAHVGVPNMCVELKLMDVPDMDYLATDLPYPRGEICLRGHNIFKGYYKDPEKTKEALDEEGWLHTGDIGQINSNGTLSIIDRKKNIFKLAQGEYIAPEKIENVYITLPLLAQLYVHGDSLESSLVAVVVPDPEVFVDWARAICGKKTATMEELCRNAVVRKAMLAELTQVGQAAKLQGFEQIKHLHLEPNLFTVENGLLTPTFKAKRDKCAAHYKPIIQELYAELKHQAPKAKL